MNLSSASAPGIAAAAAANQTQLVNLCLRLPQNRTRVIPGIDEDDDIWILVSPERDHDWNMWIVAVNNETADDGLLDFVVRRTEWWWGPYQEDENWGILLDEILECR